MDKWQVEEGGTLGDGYVGRPVIYPRSQEDRKMSNNNKGGASADDDVQSSVSTNTTGNINVPMRENDVNYKIGSYPVVEETDGVDEGDGASR